MHWVSWSKVAKPIEEGGLNLKVLAEASFFWKSKLAWSFLQNNSIWSKFMNQKYSLGSFSVLDSKLWKQIAPISSELSSDSFWKVGKGQISFWSQRWWPMDSTINYQGDLPDKTLAEVWNDDEVKSRYFEELPPEVQQFASNLQINHSEDILIWKVSETGMFSPTVFKNHHPLISRNGFSWWKNFWQPWIPTKISCFLWKCLNRAVPVDEEVQRAKIPFVSKCVCCSEGNQETLSHLLLFSEVASSVWSFLHRIFDINFQYHSIVQAAEVWIKNTSTNSQLGCLRIIAFTVAIWEIWKWRNKVIFDQEEDPATIKFRIISQMQNLNCLIVPRRKAIWWEEITFSSLHIPRINPSNKQGKWVKWCPNSQGITVNIHGTAKEDLCQGTFVARDRNGKIFGYGSKGYPGGGDYFQALLGAAVEALVSMGFSGVSEFQCDDQKFLDCLRGERAPPWRWMDQVKELRSRCDGIALNLVEIECNCVAALVSRAALASRSADFLSLPVVRRAIAEDSTGLARWSWSGRKPCGD